MSIQEMIIYIALVTIYVFRLLLGVLEHVPADKEGMTIPMYLELYFSKNGQRIYQSPGV
jgi:hypothetical protein